MKEPGKKRERRTPEAVNIDNSLEQEVVRAIREARSRLSLTQNELSRRTGIDQGDISKLEHGTRNPSLKLLKRLAEGLDMDLIIRFVPRQDNEAENSSSETEENQSSESTVLTDDEFENSEIQNSESSEVDLSPNPESENQPAKSEDMDSLLAETISKL